VAVLSDIANDGDEPALLLDAPEVNCIADGQVSCSAVVLFDL
jgi:hypothetical protein